MQFKYINHKTHQQILRYVRVLQQKYHVGVKVKASYDFDYKHKKRSEQHGILRGYHVEIKRRFSSHKKTSFFLNLEEIAEYLRNLLKMHLERDWLLLDYDPVFLRTLQYELLAFVRMRSAETGNSVSFADIVVWSPSIVSEKMLRLFLEFLKEDGLIYEPYKDHFAVMT